MTNWDLYFSSEELAAQTLRDIERYCTGSDPGCAATGIDACAVCPFGSYALMCGSYCDWDDEDRLEEWLVSEGEYPSRAVVEIGGCFVLVDE